MTGDTPETNYDSKLAAEGDKWGKHLEVEASGEWNAWLDHPLIADHYRARALVDGLPWERWVSRELSRPAAKSLDLGCGAGGRSIALYQQGGSEYLEGIDASEERVSEGERIRRELGIPGSFRVADSNRSNLPPSTYDLIFSSHSFHHFLELEHIMKQVYQSLTPRGLFILEEFVGPTQFQWTDQQINIVRSLMPLIPERMRKFRWGATKMLEGRPTPAEVVAVSPFESIRSAEIYPLFKKFFHVIEVKRLGGTLQHLLYNGIAHNFDPNDRDALRCLKAVWSAEDALIDAYMLPSDFMLLIGRRKT